MKDQSHGNYRHYYVRRRANDQYPLPLERDERLQLLNPSLFKGKAVLDVGCNSGEVSVELGMASPVTQPNSRSSSSCFGSSLAQRYQPSKVVGVDIDNALIDLCRSTVEHAFSLQSPLDADIREEQAGPTLPISVSSRALEPTRKKRKLKNGAAQDVKDPPQNRKLETDHFPAFFPQLFGTIDIQGATQLASSAGTNQEQSGINADSLDSGHSKSQIFPRNLQFYAADWTNTKIETDEAGYDVILG